MLNIGDRVCAYPDFIVRSICGARFTYSKVQRLAAMVFGGRQYELGRDDFQYITELATVVKQEFVEGNGLCQPFSVDDVLKLRAFAAQKVVESYDWAVRVLILTDGSLSGMRRHQIPAEAVCRLSFGAVIVDCVTELSFHHALSYDVIMFSEASPQDYVTLLRLQDVGKVVVFDVNENLFDIPSSHPKALAFDPMDKERHRELLQHVKCVATRREGMAREILDCPVRYFAVLHDMVDMSNILPAEVNPDKRSVDIVCITEESRQEDVEMLFTVIPDVLRDNPHVQVTFIGAMPRGFSELARPEPGSFWASHIHHKPFPETVKEYYHLLSHLPMDIALAPRCTNSYNNWESESGIMELVAKGIPVVTSKLLPTPFLTSGLVKLAEGTEDWVREVRWLCKHPWSEASSADQISNLKVMWDASAIGLEWLAELSKLSGKEAGEKQCA